MNRTDWVRLLDDLLEHPVDPVCPAFCCYNRLCAQWVQTGINRLFVDGSFKRPECCLWFQKYAGYTRGTFGIEPPATAGDLFEIVCERRAIAEAS